MPSKKKNRINEEQKKTERMSRNASLITGVFVLLMFIVHPLVIGPLRYVNITATKRGTFYTLFFALAGVLLVYFILEMASGSLRNPFAGGFRAFIAKLRLYEWAAALYILTLTLSLIFSQDPATSFGGSSLRSEGWLMMMCYVLTAVIVGRLYRPKERDMLIFCAVAALVAFYGICQYYGNDFLGLFAEGYDRASGPRMFIFSTMSNANVISTYSGIAFIVCLVLFAQRQSPLQWLYLPLSWLIFYQLILGRTNSGFLGMAAALGLAFAFIAGSRKAAARLFLVASGCLVLMWVYTATFRAEWSQSANTFAPLKGLLLPAAAGVLALAALLCFLPNTLPRIPKKLWRSGWALLVLVVVVAGVIAMPAIARATGNERIEEVAQVLRGNLDDSFGTNRGFIWKRTVAMITPKSLIIGHGPDMFSPMFAVNYGEEALATNGEVPDKVHNEYLQILFDEGAVALLLMLAVFALILWAARKRLDTPQVLAVAVAMLFFLVQAFFNICTPFVHPIVWAFWGILAAMAHRDTAPLPATLRRNDALSS